MRKWPGCWVSTCVRICCSYKVCPRWTISALAYRGCGLGPYSFQEKPVALAHGGEHGGAVDPMAACLGHAQRTHAPHAARDRVAWQTPRCQHPASACQKEGTLPR